MITTNLPTSQGFPDSMPRLTPEQSVILPWGGEHNWLAPGQGMLRFRES